jgi:hypothetical protein
VEGVLEEIRAQLLAEEEAAEKLIRTQTNKVVE